MTVNVRSRAMPKSDGTIERFGGELLIPQFRRPDIPEERIDEHGRLVPVIVDYPPKLWLDGMLDQVQDHLVDPLYELEVQRDLDTATGVWLDYIGVRLGYPRSYIVGDDLLVFSLRRNPQNAHERSFGPLESAEEDYTNVGFAPSTTIERTQGMEDDQYRDLLKGRAIMIFNPPSLATMQRVVTTIYSDGGYISETTGSVVGVVIYYLETRPQFQNVVERTEFFQPPAGVGISFSEITS